MTSAPEAEVSGTLRHCTHFIDGTWESGDSSPVWTREAPGSGAPVSQVLMGSPADVDRAVNAARRAFDEGPWPHLTALERAALLNRVADALDAQHDHIVRLDTEEAGKPIKVTDGDVTGAANLIRYAASLAMNMHGTTYSTNGPDYLGIVLREPAGVVGLITPWNFPALILCQKLPFALAAGCTVVVKPSEFTTSSTVAIVRIFEEAGLPAGVLNLVTGDGRVGQAMAEHPGIDVLSFTGSTATGRRVVEASKGNLKRLSLELGGKAANIVFSDADLDDAVEAAVFGAFFNNGECCVAQSRLLVQASIADEFVARLTERTARLRVGNPLEPTTDVGALIHEHHLNAVQAHVQQAAEAGALVASGGSRLTEGDFVSGFYLSPTVLDQVRPHMRAFQEEIFGPVVTVSRFKDSEEALALANGVDYGLSNSIWSKNIDTALDFARRLKSGTVYVNTTIDAPPQMPFGGYRSSGVGREMGTEGFEEFTEVKGVNIRTGKRSGTFLLS